MRRAEQTGTHQGPKWPRRFRTLAAFTIVAFFLGLLITPAVRADSNLTPTDASSLYLEPVLTEHYSTAVGSGLEVQIGGTDDRPSRIAGVERNIYVSIYGVLLVSDSQAEPEWILHLPLSTLAVRVARPPTAIERESQLWVWDSWIDVDPSVDPTRLFTPIFIERPETGVVAHVIDLELKLSLPTYHRSLLDWRWLEAVSLNWEPSRAKTPQWPGWEGLQSSPRQVMPPGDVRDLLIHDDLQSAIGEARSGVAAPVVMRICRECEPLAIYPEAEFALNGQSDWQVGDYDRSLPFAWDTPWYPWFWLWLGALSIVGGLCVGSVVWAVQRLLRLRTARSKH